MANVSYSGVLRDTDSVCTHIHHHLREYQTMGTNPVLDISIRGLAVQDILWNQSVHNEVLLLQSQNIAGILLDILPTPKTSTKGGVVLVQPHHHFFVKNSIISDYEIKPLLLSYQANPVSFVC
jgi:hypothetical protein